MIKILGQYDISWIDNTNSNSNYFQIQDSINYFIKDFLAIEKLYERLEKLLSQFYKPQFRAWKVFEWTNINRGQITGIDLEIFCSVFIGVMDTETCIRVYT